MATFQFRGVERASGRRRTGRVEADSLPEARDRLAGEGLQLTRLGPVRDLRPRWIGGQRWTKMTLRGRSATLEERAWLTRQLGMLLAAGVPLLAALELLVRQERRDSRRRVVEALASTVRAGLPLSQGLARHAGWFDALAVSLVRAGEAAGRLDETLLRLSRVLEASARLRARVLAALAYPALVAAVASFVVGALLLFVVPRFEQLFLTQFPGRVLPTLTRGVLGLSHLLLQQGFWLVAIAPLAVAALMRLARSASWRVGWRRALQRFPVVSRVVQAGWLARWSRTLGVLLAAGVPILEALALAREAAGVDGARRAMLRGTEERVGAGVPLSRALSDRGVVPDTVLVLLEVGEATGRLAETLDRLAELYDEEVDRAVTTLTALVEPCLIVFLALGVGTVVIALFLPMIDVIRALSGG